MKFKTYTKYKDSGIDWIGEIPEGWEVHRIKSFVPCIKNGQWGDDSSGGNNDFIVLRVADFLEFNFDLNKELTIRNIKNTKLRLKEGDLVIEKSGGGEKQIVGRVVQLKNPSKEKKYTYSNFIGKFEISNRMNKTFLNYYFKAFYNNRVNFNYIKQTTGIQNLDSASLIQREYFAYPTDKNYQKSIVSFLDKKIAELDELIEKDKKLIELLKEKRAASINHAVTKGLPVRRTQIGLDQNVKMKDSGIEWIGEIPEDWEILRLRYLLKNGIEGIKIGPFGSMLKSDEITNNGYKVYGQENVINRNFNKGSRYINEDKFKQLIGYQIHPGDLIVTMMGTIGKAQIIPTIIDEGIMDSHLIRLRFNGKVETKFIEILINSSNYIKGEIKYFSKGSIMEGLNSGIIKDLLLCIPQKIEQTKIIQFVNRKVTKIDKTIQKIEEKINFLEEYKKSLIHHTVTGKIDIREVKI